MDSDVCRRRIGRLRVREVGARLFRLFLGKPVDVAVHLAARREDDREAALPAELENVERHDRVLEGAVRLANELMHLGVRGQMHDEIHVGILDAADAAGERRVVTREVLE